jgi:hypothetical protein
MKVRNIPGKSFGSLRRPLDRVQNLNADLDPDPDPGCQSNADPDPGLYVTMFW